MEPNKTLEALMDALTESMSDNELLLSIYQSDIAAAITGKRISMNMNQTAFAEFLGVSQGLVSRWENGDTNFTLKTLVDLAQKLSLKLTIKLEDETRKSAGHAPEYGKSQHSNVIDFIRASHSYHTISSTPGKWSFSTSNSEELKEM